jgi:peroxiredoxin Q/BCP
MPQTENTSISADLAPGLDIALCDQNGVEHRLGDNRGRITVVFFYPKDDTPGCTVEGKEFRDNFEAFEALDAKIVGVSLDSVESHRAYAEKHAFPFTLLADTKGDLARAFGVLQDGYAARSTFVIGPQLRIRRAFQNVNPRGHARQVLDFIKTLADARRMLGG